MPAFLILVVLLGSLSSGLVTVDKAGPHLHKEVLKEGKADFSTLNK